MKKLSAREGKILVGGKQGPYRRASKANLKLRDRGKKKKGKAVTF